MACPFNKPNFSAERVVKMTMVRSEVFFCLFALLVRPLFAQAPFFPLPQDEKEAFAMLKEGTLDSMTWLKVHSFYEHPLLVPQGELRTLADVFPGLLASAPADARSLSAYEPWGEADIERFFGDFPELAHFRPVLSFETARAPYRTRIGCSLHKYKNDDPAVVAGFATPAAHPVAVEGQAGFEAAVARWRHRAAVVGTGGTGKLTVGNFHLNMDRGLFYGYFPASALEEDSAWDWRFASSPAWNGALYESPAGSHACAAAFYHERHTERAFGARLALAGLGRFRVLAGASRLILPGPAAAAGAFSYAHTEVNYSDGFWNSGAVVGCEKTNPGAIPLFLYAAHCGGDSGGGGAGFEASYARLPQGCEVRRSALFHEAAGKTGETDGGLTGRSVVKTTTRFRLAHSLSSSCGASYYQNSGRGAAEGFVSLSGAAWVRFALRYTFRPPLDSGKEYHCITASLSRRACRGLVLQAYCRSVNRDEAYRSVFARLTASITALPSMEVAPFAAMYCAGSGDREFSLGFTQTLRLFEKTWGELKLEIPVIKTFSDQAIVDVRAFFWL
jgi:hypothetical protein